MRIRLFPLLFLITIITVGCAASGAGAPDTARGHVHIYKLEPGDVVGFTNETDMLMEMDIPDLPIPQPMEMSLSMVQRLEVEDVEDGVITGELVNEDFSLSGMGDMLGQMGVGDLGNMRLPVKMTERGHSEMSISAEMAGRGGGMVNMPGGLNSFFVPWPDYPVEVGSSWIDSVAIDSDQMSQMGLDMTGTMITEFTYLGLEMVEGSDDAPMSHKVHAVLSGSMSGSMDQAQGSMMMSGTWSGETDYWFDRDDGLLLSSLASLRTSMLIEMIAPMDMVIPMDMQMKATIRREK
jgi:hypothetical protein